MGVAPRSHSNTARKLNSRVLKQPDTLSMVLGQVVEGDARHRRHRRRILRLQRELRALVTEDAWKVYLRLEEACALRLAEATELVTVWAFKQGRRRR